MPTSAKPIGIVACQRELDAMSQRLLDTNESLIQATTDRARRTRLLQDRAVLLSRLGRTEDATTTIEAAFNGAPADLPIEVRLRFDYVRSIRTYFSKKFVEAMDQMVAVREQAQAAHQAVLLAECESALALYSQREGDVRAACKYANSVLASRQAPDEARYRAYLALATLHQDAYNYEEAARLYVEAEQVVRRLGDEIATASWQQRGALTMAAHARQAAAVGELDSKALNRAIDALRKSISYATGLEGGPDTTLDHLLLAEMRVLQKRHADALAIYDAHLPRAEGDGFLHEVTAALADRARCRIELGDVDAGYADLVAALRRVDESTPADVRAIVHDNMATALARLGRGTEAEQHRLLGRMGWDTYSHEQREARRLLSGEPSDTVH